MYIACILRVKINAISHEFAKEKNTLEPLKNKDLKVFCFLCDAF